MPKQEKQTAPTHFKGMAEFFELMAQNQYKEWSDMKYKRKVNGGPGHKSKKDFDNYKRFVYQCYKLSLHRVELLKAVAKELESGEMQDFEKVEAEGAIKRTSRIITGNFKNLIP